MLFLLLLAPKAGSGQNGQPPLNHTRRECRRELICSHPSVTQSLFCLQQRRYSYCSGSRPTRFARCTPGVP